LVQKSSTFDVTVAVISNETFDWYLCLLKIVYVFLMLQLQRNQEVYNLYEMTCLKNGENWINIYPFFCHFFPSSNLIFLCIIFCVCCNAQRSEVSYEVILFFPYLSDFEVNYFVVQLHLIVIHSIFSIFRLRHLSICITWNLTILLMN
jgi:hypothetical protein